MKFSKPTIKTILGGLVLLFFAVASFPDYYTVQDTGLDPSWVFALNYIHHFSIPFGDEVAYSYGPLGYLLVPLDYGNHLEFSLLLRIVVHGYFLLALYLFIFQEKKVLEGFFFAFFYLLAQILILSYEYHLLLVLGLWYNLKFLRSSPITHLTALSGLFAGFFMFMKFSIGFGALAIIVVGEGILLFYKKQKWVYSFVPLILFIATVFFYPFSISNPRHNFYIG